MMASNVNLRFLFDLESKGGRSVATWCMENALFANAFKCPKCGESMDLTDRIDRSDGCSWSCRSNDHEIKRSVRIGSCFNDSNIPTSTILLIMYMWTIKCTNEFILKELKTSNSTLIDWKKFFREICLEACIKDSVKLGGQDKVVEIYEGKLERPSFSRHQRRRGEWAYVGYDKEDEHFFIRVVESRGIEVLMNIIKENILPSSVVISDCWRKYRCFSNQSFMQLEDEFSLKFKNPRINSRKKFMRKENSRGGFSPGEEFHPYMIEYLWRKRHCEDSRSIFSVFLDAVKQVYPLGAEDQS